MEFASAVRKVGGEGGGEGCRMLSDGDSDSDGIPPMIEIPP